MFFDCTLHVFDVQIMGVTDEENNFENPHLVLNLVTGLVLPGPQGQRGVLPAGVFKVPIGKEMAKELGEKLSEGSDELPEPKPPSQLEVVGDLNAAEQMAAQAQAMERDFKGSPE